MPTHHTSPRCAWRNMVPDAHPVVLAIEHGLELNSPGGDFARFIGLRTRSPLNRGPARILASRTDAIVVNQSGSPQISDTDNADRKHQEIPNFYAT
jgi:hypothetical protein